MLNIQFVTVGEAATIIGCTDSRVRQLLISGDIDGQKFGEKMWMVPKSEAERVKNTAKTGPGRPRKNS